VSVHTPHHTISLDHLLTRLPGALQAFFTPFITREINYGYGFVFAGCNLAAAVFTYFFLYESSGISLEMIDAMYSEPGLKPWQSEKWAPEVSLNDPGVVYRSPPTDSSPFHPQPYASRKEAIRDEKSKGESMMLEHSEHGENRRRFDSSDSQRTAAGPTPIHNKKAQPA
jgi:hypothetical protein